jgi:ubiquitin carboxyl-terminal hydrolase 47
MENDDDKLPMKPDFLVSSRHQDILAEKRQRERDQLVQTYFRDGPHVYELFSILIHSGSASSGHYYAYIKSFELGRWFEFNDSTVKEIKDSDIKEVFGGSKQDMLGDSYGANAYLLCYRRIEQSNVNVVRADEVPEHVKKTIEEARLKEEQENLERAERYSLIHVKVSFGAKEKSLDVKPELKLGDFKLKAMELLGLSTPAEEVRVRAYNSYNDILQEVYEDDKTLDDCNIFNYKHLALETRTPGTEWPPYDPNAINLKVYVWDESIASQPNLGLESKIGPPVKVQVSKLASVKDMTQLFGEKFGIDVDHLKVLKKSYIGASNYIEVVNTLSNASSSILYARVYEGTVLYIEHCADMLDKSKWVEEIERETRRYKIKFNHPDQECSFIGQSDYSYQVSLDCSQTLTVLKEAIAKELRLPQDKFMMKRGSKYGVELKDMTLKLTQANLLNGSIIHVEKGIPTNPDDCRLQVHLAEIARHSKNDGMAYDFYELLEIPINSKLDISAVKEAICEQANLAYPSLNLTPDLIRLRERSSERLCRIMRNSEILKNFTLYDRKQIALQVLSEPEEVKATELIVVVRRWFPTSWLLSTPQEMFINRYTTVYEFYEKLSAFYDIPVKPRQVEDLEVCRISYTWNFMRGDLLSESWKICTTSISYLSQEPWYLTMDGVLFL